MDVWVGRQPIFDGDVKVRAYEVLYRSGARGSRHVVGEDRATAETIVHTFIDLGLETITGGRRAFLNFSREMLVGGFAELLPADAVVIEVLEHTGADDAVIEACDRLKRAGYRLALDDYVHGTGSHELLVPMADIIKVDFKRSSVEARLEAVRQLKRPGRVMLAEKVESERQFEWARRNGYEHFQGFFFARPSNVHGEQIPQAKASYIRLLSMLREQTLDLDELAGIIKSDVSLSHTLLRMLNSAGFAWRRRIESVRHALVALGEDATRRWLSLLCLTAIAADRPPELVVQSLTRARFLEALAPGIGLESRQTDLFFMGVVSLLGAILRRPLAAIVPQLGLPEDVEAALLGRGTDMGHALDLARAFENGDWRSVSKLCGSLGASLQTVPGLYIEAAQHATRALGIEDRGDQET